MGHSCILLIPVLLVLTVPDPIILPASDKIIIDYNENTHQSISYSSVFMSKIRTKVYENHTLRIIDRFTCSNIKTFGLTGRRKRGRRGGRQVKLKYQITTQKKMAPTFLLLNSRSMWSKEFLIREEIDSLDTEFVVVTKTWLRNEHASWVSCSQFNRDS